MRLLNFPAVILRKVFENFSFEELLLLTFCSNRFKHLIRSNQHYRFNRITTIEYHLLSNNIIYITPDPRSLNMFKRFSQCVTLSPYRFRYDHETPIHVFGMKRNTACNMDYSSKWATTYLYDRNQKEAVIQGVHDYVYRFFGSPIDYQIRSTNNELPPILKGVSRSEIKISDELTTEELESYFTDYPAQEYIKVEGNLNGRLSHNSVIYDMNYLEIDTCGNYGDDILLNFKGRNLIFRNTDFDISSIIQFLNEWKTNQGFENLKSLSIDLDDNYYPNVICFDKKKIIKMMRNVEIHHLCSSKDVLKAKSNSKKPKEII
ncbi:hypothetical protein CRE_30993 [Caenorhabditis remanei]|uniref:Uncharacterized protein n=1 Tax=Caenorhabditis remanei TaxID=31234 RepID=E3LTZ2_CAERE|nr:hypothetical protein CRE_30993 [Caenorhabditis remanei]